MVLWPVPCQARPLLPHSKSPATIAGTEYDLTSPGPRSLLQGVCGLWMETLKFEIFCENPKIDAGGGDKL